VSITENLEPVEPGNGPRGVDHVGLSVVDVDTAERFLIEGLGAEFLYETLGFADPPIAGTEVERGLGIPPGARINLIRMYRLGTGPGIELFQYSAGEQHPAARACDLGWQHLAVYVDDLDAAIARFVAAGGTMLAPARDLPGVEGGDGNRLCYLRAPFGALVELLTYPSPQPYETRTSLRRWKPPTEGGHR
jgi:catechol 2,3-dioxygenase-like lactoylglutathione lyase family enzyme